jgi:hypothetical protein
LTAFTDGCPGLRHILADAGVAETPILDWFHIGMRLEHLKQIAGALTTGNPLLVTAKAVIVTEVERLHWRIWNGKAKNAQKSIVRIRAVMHHFRGEPDNRKSAAPSRKLWTALHALDGYLIGQSAWLVNYAGASPRGFARRNRDHRGDGQFHGEPSNEQISADAMVTPRRGFAASGSLRHLQWHARFRLRTEVLPSERRIPVNGGRRLTPSFAAVPTATTAAAGARTWGLLTTR